MTSEDEDEAGTTVGDFLVDLGADAPGGAGAAVADGAMVSLSPIEAGLVFFFAIAQAKGVVASEDKTLLAGSSQVFAAPPRNPTMGMWGRDGECDRA